MTGASDMENIVWGADHPQFDWTVEDFFEGREDVYADLSFWCKTDWTVDEATTLSFGFNPSVAEWGSLAAAEHPFTIEYENRRKLALRAIANDQLPNNDKISPIAYVRWATSVGIQISSDLKKGVMTRGKVQVAFGAADDIPNPKVLKSLFRLALGLTKDAYYGQGPYNPDDSLCGEIVKDLAAVGFITQTDTVKRVLHAVKNEDEVDKFTEPADHVTLMKLVLGLAIKHYDYDPKANRNVATTKIADVLRHQQKPLDEDTVRRRLREAKAALRE